MGEAVIAETGHLLTLGQSLDLQTSTGGGFMSGIKRAIGGSSFFVNEIQATRGPGRAIFASPSPGHVQELDISAGKEWLCQPNVFLCADSTVAISAALTKSFGAGLFGGTGFILQSLTGQGKAFVHVGGASINFDLAPGELLRVETGALAAFDGSMEYSIEMVRGLKSILFSGEGLWFATLRGPGRVYVQSLALAKLAHSLMPYLPAVGNGGAGISTAVAGTALGGLLGGLLGGNSDD
jgi:uncharacterized protein (TIGR00266 family)